MVDDDLLSISQDLLRNDARDSNNSREISVDGINASSANEDNSIMCPQDTISQNSIIKLSPIEDNLNYNLGEAKLDISSDNELLSISNANYLLTYDHTYDLEPYHDAVRNYLAQFPEVSRGSTYSGGGSQGVHVYWAPLYPVEGSPVTIVIDVERSFKSVKISVGGQDYQTTLHDGGQYFTYTINNPQAASGLDINPQGSSHATISEFHVYYKSSVSLSIDKSSITIGDSIKLTPNVIASTSGSTVTTGTITYYLSDGTKIGTSASNAYLNYKPTNSGDYRFYAEYEPDKSDTSHLYQPGTSNTVDLTVNRKTPTVGISVSSVTYPNRAVATVTTNAPGTYSVLINGKSYSLTFSSGQTSKNINVDLLPPKMEYDASVSFAGNTEWEAASSKTTFNIYEGDVSFNANLSPNTIYYDESTHIISTVSGTGSASTVTYVFDDGTDSLTYATGASFDYTPKLSGNRTIYATYNANGNYSSKTVKLEVMVNKIPTQTSISLNKSKIVLGEKVLISTNIRNGTNIVMDGEVEIFANGRSIVTVSAGQSYEFTPSTDGDYIFTANYKGTEKYKESDSTISPTLDVLTKSHISLTANGGTDLTIAYGNDINISNIVTPNDATGKVRLLINGSDSGIENFNVNDNIIEQWIPGKYVLTATYDGNNVYGSSVSNEVIVNVVKADINVKVNVIDVTYPNVSNGVVTANVDGNYIVTINNKKYSVNVVLGTGSFTVDKLDADTYDVLVEFDGNSTHNYVKNESEFTVYKGETELDLVADLETLTYGQNDAVIATPVASDATGNITYYIDGKKLDTLDINQKLDLGILAGGQYNITAIYNGDRNYNSTKTSKIITVNPKDPNLKIEVTDTTYPNAATVKVTSEVDGTYTVDINGTKVDITVKDGVGTNTVKLPANNYNATVSFVGNENYTAASVFDVFKVNKCSDYNFFANATYEVIYHGQNNTLNAWVDVDDATGTVEYVYFYNGKVIGHSDINSSLVPTDIPTGNRYVIATYSGDSNYVSKSADIHFVVLKIVDDGFDVRATPDTFVYGGSTYVTATVNATDATGKVIYYIQSNKVGESEINGGIILYDLPVGTYLIMGEYEGDDNYNASTDNCKVVVTPAGSVVVVPDVEKVYHSSYTLSVDVVNATGVSVRVLNGSGVVSADVVVDGDSITIDGLDVGEYTLEVTTLVDGNHRSVTNISSIKVTPAGSVVVVSDVEKVYHSSYTLSVDVVNATGVSVRVLNGSGVVSADVVVDGDSITIDGLDVGEYTLEVTTLVDGNHRSVTNTSSIKVTPAGSVVVVSDVEKVYHSSYTLSVDVVNATGVSVRVLNGSGVVSADVVVDGDSITIDGLDVGEYTLEVTTLVDGNHRSVTNTSSIKVTPAGSSVSSKDVIEVYGNIVKVNVTSDNATSIKYELINGSGVFKTGVINYHILSISDLNVGDYTLRLTTNVDNNHKSSQSTSKIKVIKANSNVDVTGDTIEYGNVAKVSVNITNATSGHYEIYDENNHVVDNGYITDSLNIEGLNVGIYTIKVTTVVNDNYNEYTGEAKIVVNAANSSVIVPNVSEVYGNDVIINVTTVNSTGNVKVTVKDEKGNVITPKIKINGNLITILDLVVGNYTIDVTTNVDDNHIATTGRGNIAVIKANSTVKANNVSVTYGDPITIDVSYVNASSVKYEIVNESGIVKSDVISGKVISVSELNAGNYMLNLITVVDDNHSSVKNVYYINVTKADPNLTIDVTDSTYPNNVTITVTSKVDGKYVVDINGTSIEVEVKDGEGVKSIKKPANIYNATVSFESNANYNNDSAYDVFKVNKCSDYNFFANATYDVIYHGQNNTLNAWVDVGDATGTVEYVYFYNGNVIGHSDINSSLVATDIPTGNRYVIATYSGDSNYEPKSADIHFVVLKIVDDGFDVQATPDTFVYGGSTYVTATVNASDATGKVIYYIQSNKVGESEINGGITLSNLPVGTYLVRGEYEGDSNYNASTDNCKIVVTPANSTVVVDDVTINHGQTVNLSVEIKNATGIKFDVLKDGKVIFSGENKSNMVIISNLNPGNYTLKVSTQVDSNHTSATKEAKITVLPIIDLEVKKTVDYTKADVDDIITYVLIVTNNGPSNATDVNVTEKLSNLVEFFESFGDGVYDNKTNIWYIGNISHGEDAVLTLKVKVISGGIIENSVIVSANENDSNNSNNNASSDNVTANSVVDLSINKTVNTTLADVGKHLLYTITVVNNGPSTATNVTVTDELSPLVKYLDSNSSVGIKFDEKTNMWFVGNLAKGQNATLYIIVEVTGKGNVVNAVSVKSNENDTDDSNNNGSSNNVTVADAAFNASATPQVFPFRNFTVLNSTVSNPNATGTVSYYFDDGTDSIEDIEIGQTVVYTPTTAGIHNITVVYSGDDNFNGVTVIVSVNVTLGDAGFDANAIPDSIVFGDSTNLNSTVSDKDATGNVTYVFDDGTESIVADIGEIVNYIPLSAGNHTIEVIYSGDDNFDGVTVYVNVIVAKSDDSGFDASATPQVFPFRNFTVLNSTVSNPKATGNVSYYFDDDTPAVENIGIGEAVNYIPKSAGINNITVVYSGDDNFNGVNKTITVEVTPIDAGFNATVNATDVVYGDSVELNSSVEFEDAAGNVTYVFDDGTDPVVADIGEVVVYTPKSAGEHVITVVYSGDGNFNNATVILSVNVSKSDDSGFDANATPDVFPFKDSTVLNSGVVNLNATGDVTYVFDDGSNVTVPVGTPVVYTPNSSGNHTVDVIYSGDDNFNGVNKTITVEVTPIDAGFNATVNATDVVYGDSVELNSSVEFEDAAGNVTYVFDDGTDPVVADIGEVVVYTPKSAGEHVITVVYSGDDNFVPETVVLTVKVSKSDDSGFDANATPDVFPFKDSTVLNSGVVNPNATGDVTYVFDDGSNVTVPVGTPVVYTPNSTGNHTVDVIYSGDDNFNGVNKTITVEVTKIDAGFNSIITPNETVLTESIYLNSSVIDEDATGNVTYIFEDGTVITTNIGEEMKYVPKEVGNHTVKVIYSGDDKFNGAEITLKYTIVESGLRVNITAITKTVVVGDQVVFNITVFNGGNVPLTHIVVSQIEIGNLDYVKLIDDSKLWIEITNELSENGLLQASSDLRSWRYLGILYPNESVSFNAVYDTYVPGTFDNEVIATSDEVQSLMDIDFVRVLTRSYVISIEALNDTINVGDKVLFKVILNNTGEVNITNISFSDIPDEGLIYDSFIDQDNVWIKGNGLTWTFTKILTSGNSSEFLLVFNTDAPGNFTNAVVYDNGTVNATVSVNPIENKTEDNTTEMENETEDNTTEMENETVEVNKNQLIIDNNKTTGNPLIILLLVLFAIIPLRRFKK